MAAQVKRGLVMMGGGARAAYQIGVLKAVAELVPKGSPSPFQIISGTSAGAINAVSLATMADNFHHATAQLLRVWGSFKVSQVFYTDALHMLKTGLLWLAAMAVGGLGRNNPVALLNRKPLRALLRQRLDFSRIASVIADGHLHAISVTASGYASGQSVTFYQGQEGIEPWARVRRCGCRTEINLDHLMASSAIPYLFQAIKVNREYFGDGSMRQMAPLSAALHLGADRILVIGNEQDDDDNQTRMSVNEYPSFAQIAGHILDSIFLDSLEADLERLERINKTIEVIPSRKLKRGGLPLRKVEASVIAPSADIGQLAVEYISELPRSIRFLLRGLGGLKSEGSGLASYLLFERGYCRELIRLGYRDTMNKKEMIEQFLA